MGKLTAMQKHISDMYEIKEMVISKKVDKDLEETILETIDGCIENAVAYLKKEKQQIIEARINGHNASSSTIKQHDAENYYNETFKK